MVNLLYIGNKLANPNSNITTIETLGNLLIEEGYNVRFASNKQNKIVRLLNMLFAVVKYSKSTDYVLIDTYSTLNFYYALFVSQLCRLLKLKYIPILHGGDLPKRLATNRRLSGKIFNNAHVLVSPSKYQKTKFEEHGINNIEYIPNSIEIEKYPYKTRETKSPKLLWVRAFKEIYNPLMAIQIFKNLKDDGLDATLCMIGPDGDGSFLYANSLARKLGVDVKFTGKLSKEQWIKVSNDYNIFINTSYFDNMPVTLIEAMALGLPVVTTNVGGIPSFTENDKNVLHVNPNDVDGMVDAIKIIITNPDIPSSLSTNARMVAEQFDWSIVKKSWKAILK